MAEIPDSLLVVRLQNRDEEAFKLIVEGYKSMVYNVCLNFISIAEDAEELTQDVFVELYKSVDSFRGDSKLKTWIYRIAISKCLEFERKAKRKKRLGFMLSIGNIAETEFEPIYHPSVEVENKERANKIFNEIKKLAENQRIAFNLYHIEGMNYNEITEIMDMSLSSVESLIFRAKSKLRKNLVNFK